MKMYHCLLMWLFDNHNEIFQEWAQYIGVVLAAKEALEVKEDE